MKSAEQLVEESGGRYVVLGQQHVKRAVASWPVELRKWIVWQKPGSVFVAGGAVLSSVLREKARDIDVFGDTGLIFGTSFYTTALGLSGDQVAKYIGVGSDPLRDDTPNGATFKHLDPPVQLIYAWSFDSPLECLDSFDLSLSRAAVWCDYSAAGSKPMWEGICDRQYFEHIAARMCVFRYPTRGWSTSNVDAGAGLLRLFKFVARGWTVPVDSIAEVVARMTSPNPSAGPSDPDIAVRARGLIGLLHEAYPNGVNSMQPQGWERLLGTL